MTPSPAISVLLAVYNREPYIAASIDSVLAQTHTDFELIICDDGSTDATRAIVEKYAKRDARIRFAVNERNLGQFENRRYAASLARGVYLKYHDSDDVIYPHCLETMLRALDAEPRAAFALSGSHHWPGGPCPMLLTPRLSYEREFLGSGLFHLGPAAALFRADAFRELGGFPVAGVATDYQFCHEACA
jgi:glycosyltransferase involved in cell wall biosynthesis